MTLVDDRGQILGGKAFRKLAREQGGKELLVLLIEGRACMAVVKGRLALFLEDTFPRARHGLLHGLDKPEDPFRKVAITTLGLVENLELLLFPV